MRAFNPLIRFLCSLRYRKLNILMAGTLALSGCSGGPPPKLYLLEFSEADTFTAELARKSGISSLGMSLVELPGYSAAAQIASISVDGTILQDDANRWAEEPEEAITRLLSERLRVHTEATVLVEPWPRDYEPMARVEVSFDKLLRKADGGATMAGQILLLSGDGRKLLKAVPFNIQHSGLDVDNRVFFLAVARGVDDLARLAVEQIQALNTKS